MLLLYCYYNNIDSLIEKDFTLNYVVKDINKLPQCIPSTIDPLSNFDRILKLESLFANFTNYNYKSIDLTKNNSINITLDKPNDSNKSNNVTYATVVNDNSNNNNIHSKNNYIKPTSISSEGEFTNVINKNKKNIKNVNNKFMVAIQIKVYKNISNKNIKIIDIKLVSNKESKCNSYKLTVDMNTANTILNANIWPYGVCISKWYSRKLPYNDTDSQVSNKYSTFSLR